jgi:hypothetical protein
MTFRTRRASAMKFTAASEQRSDRCSESLAQTNRYAVEKTADFLRVIARFDQRIEDTRAVEVQPETSFCIPL